MGHNIQDFEFDSEWEGGLAQVWDCQFIISGTGRGWFEILDNFTILYC